MGKQETIKLFMAARTGTKTIKLFMASRDWHAKLPASKPDYIFKIFLQTGV